MTIKLSLPTGENISQQARGVVSARCSFPIVRCDTPLSTPALTKSKGGFSMQIFGRIPPNLVFIRPFHLPVITLNLGNITTVRRTEYS